MQSQELQYQLRGLSLPQTFWYSTALAAFFLVVVISAGKLTQSSPLFPLVISMGINLSPILGFVFSWAGIRRYAYRLQHQPFHDRRFAWLPVIFSTALLLQSIACCLYTYNVFRHLPLSPSWGDAVMSSMYPLLTLGVLGFPMKALSGRTRLCILLDSVLAIGTLLTLSWYFLLGPSLLLGTKGDLLTSIIRLGHPCLDLLVMSCVIILLMQLPAGPFRLPASMLCVAFALYVLTDSIFQYQTLRGSSEKPGWSCLGWVVGPLLTALAIQSIRWAIAHPITGEQNTSQSPSLKAMSIGRALLPYTLVPVVLVVDFSVWDTGRSSGLALGTYGLSLLVLALIFLKQILALREIHWLNHWLERARQALHEKNEALQRANSRLETLAMTDPLTELPNHRSIMEYLGKELYRARRYNRPLSLIFFDIDHFKQINDTAGHTAGDIVLSQIGQRAARMLRGGDTLGRFGGEEFVALLPDTDTDAARQIAERLRAALEVEPIILPQIEEGITISVSVGLSAYPIDADCEQGLLTQADEAMYLAKHLGRNQVCTALEARQAGADRELIALLQQDERREAARREANQGERLRETYTVAMVCSLLALLQGRDNRLSTHAHAVSDLATAIAQRMQLEPQVVERIGFAALLHNIGNVGIPDWLLQKNGPLTAAERSCLQEHTELGAQILQASPFLTDLVPGVLHHHERWDGSGFPAHLAGQDIPLVARIIAVAEAYDSLLQTLPSQVGYSPEHALLELQRGAGTQFDPIVVQALADLIQTTPQAEKCYPELGNLSNFSLSPLQTTSSVSDGDFPC